MSLSQHNWLILALSGAGVILILLGLVALALPETQEGVYVFQLNSQHSFRLMDVVGVFVLGLGVILNWLGGTLWKYQMRF
ncbi:MAG TPA: hypothetical protein PLH19_11840 [Anaerolineae bacterium]|nr:hypothetical protein [Anaerolineae bacterium]HQH39211.1 hypothetical protein [Anaerolineae bacterium]